MAFMVPVQNLSRCESPFGILSDMNVQEKPRTVKKYKDGIPLIYNDLSRNRGYQIDKVLLQIKNKRCRKPNPEGETPAERRRRYTWAELLRKGFQYLRPEVSLLREGKT